MSKDYSLLLDNDYSSSIKAYALKYAVVVSSFAAIKLALEDANERLSVSIS